MTFGRIRWPIPTRIEALNVLFFDSGQGGGQGRDADALRAVGVRPPKSDSGAEAHWRGGGGGAKPRDDAKFQAREKSDDCTMSYRLRWVRLSCRNACMRHLAVSARTKEAFVPP